MGWLRGGLVAYCTASLVVGSDGALTNTQNARTSNTRDFDERFPILPRSGLSFRNDTSVPEKSIYTARTSAVPTGSAAVTPTETVPSTTSILREHGSPSKFPSPVSFLGTLLEPSSNVHPTPSALYSSGVVSHTTAKVSITHPIIAVSTGTSKLTWESEQIHSDRCEIASSINPSRTGSSLAVTPESKPSLGDSLVPPLLQDVVSSQTPGAQLPIFMSASTHWLSNSLSSSLLSTAYAEAPRHRNESTTSSVVPYPETTQNAELWMSELVFVPTSTAAVSSQEQQHVEVPTKTSSGFPNFGTALSILSNASKSATDLQRHLVSSLADWPPLTFSSADASRSSGTEVLTGTATTLTRSVPQQTASTPEVVENFPSTTAPVLNNTWTVSILPTIRSEGNAASAPWLSLVFTWANSQTTILSTPSLSAKSAIPTTSVVYTSSNSSGAAAPTSQTSPIQSVTSSALSLDTRPLLGDSSSSLPEFYPSSAPGDDGISRRVSSRQPLSMTQTRLQLPSISTLFTQTPLMFTPIQTVTPTRTLEAADAQYVSSSTFSSATSLPYSTISTSFIGWTNSSTYKPAQASATLSQPTNSTMLGTNSSINPLVVWHMSRTSSQHLYSTSTSPPVSKYMEISSFVTRIKTPSSESSSQTALVASDIDTITTSIPSTTPLPMYSPTETVAATPSPPLTSSETVGVAVGSTAGLLLAIAAAVFVARRYYMARSAKYGSDESSGAYPQLAYLYDPSLGGAESDNGGDDETSTFMSGGATGRPLSSIRNKTPPPPPHNSVDFGYRRLYSPDARYSDPGNPFTDLEDPFLEWRSSDAITTPSDTRLALAAAVARYSNGPQKPLPALPESTSTHAFRNHHIPSPTLSPITNNYGLPRNLVRSSSRSSVQSQRSLKKFHSSSSSSSGSRDYVRERGQSLTSIHETYSHQWAPDQMEHDLLLPIDTQSETCDSVILYASTLTSKSLTQYSIPPLLNNNSASISTCEKPDTKPPQDFGLRSKSSLRLSKRRDPSNPNATLQSARSSESSPVNPTTTDISYADFPSPPSSTFTPTHKGWDDIKRTSTDYTILMSPLSPVSPFSISPILPSPPPPLKKRSLINLPQKTGVSGTVTMCQPMSSLNQRSVPAPLRINTRFSERKSKGFDVQRSWLDKAKSMGDMRGEETRV